MPPSIEDMIRRGIEWQTTQLEKSAARLVTWSGLRNGELIVLSDVIVVLGSSQTYMLSNLGTDQNDMSMQHPSEVDRDYIVRATALGVLWEPSKGDFVDDPHDLSGVNRYEVKPVGNQQYWRWEKGSYNIKARVHTRFKQQVGTYWLDSFTGGNGTALTSHTAEVGDGSYAEGGGTVQLLDGRMVSGDTDPAYKYFAVGKALSVARVDFSVTASISTLSDSYAELGLIVRAAPTGANQREGYFCTIRVGYDETGSTQLRQLRIVRRHGTANTTQAVLDLSEPLGLDTRYRLEVRNFKDRVSITLLNDDGTTRGTLPSPESTLLNTNTSCGVCFQHTMSDPQAAWMDNLIVSAS